MIWIFYVRVGGEIRVRGRHEVSEIKEWRPATRARMIHVGIGGVDARASL